MDLQEASAMSTSTQDCLFPLRLHRLLDSTEKTGKSCIVSWLPGGKSFRVHDRAVFANKVLPLFFGTSKYKSYQRNLNLWGFRTVPKGPEKGRCFHPRFQKGLPNLCHSMERVTVKGAAAKRSQVSSKGHASLTLSHLRRASFDPLLGTNIQFGSTRGNPIDASNLTRLLNHVKVLNGLRGFSPEDGSVERTRLLLGSRPAGHASCSLNDILYRTSSPLVGNGQAFPVLVANDTDMITRFAQAAEAHRAAAPFVQGVDLRLWSPGGHFQFSL
jgi:hypothetical protein